MAASLRKSVLAPPIAFLLSLLISVALCGAFFLFLPLYLFPHGVDLLFRDRVEHGRAVLESLGELF